MGDIERLGLEVVELGKDGTGDGLICASRRCGDRDSPESRESKAEEEHAEGDNRELVIIAGGEDLDGDVVCVLNLKKTVSG